jgi:hypothetical protein
MRNVRAKFDELVSRRLLTLDLSHARLQVLERGRFGSQTAEQQQDRDDYKTG